MEKEDFKTEKQASDNGLAKLVAGIVLASAALLPLSGCYEDYNYPRYRTERIIVVPRERENYPAPRYHRQFENREFRRQGEQRSQGEFRHQGEHRSQGEQRSQGEYRRDRRHK